MPNSADISSGGSQMRQPPDAFLIVEKGKPYGIGEALPLSRGRALLGAVRRNTSSIFPFFLPTYPDGMPQSNTRTGCMS